MLKIDILRDTVYKFEQEIYGRVEALVYVEDIYKLNSLEDVLNYYLEWRNWGEESFYVKEIGRLFIKLAEAKVVE